MLLDATGQPLPPPMPPPPMLDSSGQPLEPDPYQLDTDNPLGYDVYDDGQQPPPLMLDPAGQPMLPQDSYPGDSNLGDPSGQPLPPHPQQVTCDV